MCFFFSSIRRQTMCAVVTGGQTCALPICLADIAANHIRQEIVRGRWELGERIPNESTLSALLKVSRVTVREAVKMLVSQGLLETRQGSGTYVRAHYDLSGKIGRASCRERVCQ